jgi:hypothetical protein
MSDQEIGKKEVERSDLYYFLAAYEYVTGQRLAEICAHECPDFICARPSSGKLGVELARIMRDPEQAHFERILCRMAEADPQETLDRVFSVLDKKDDTRSKNYGCWTYRTILVLQLLDCPVRALQLLLSDDMKQDFAGYGFVEIWLADYTAIDAYGDIELFGLAPLRWWGHHERRNPYRKPYG